MFEFLRKLFGKPQSAVGNHDEQSLADRHSPQPTVSSDQVIVDDEIADKLRLVTYIDILRERGYTLTENKISLLAQPAERALNRLTAAGMTAQQAQRIVDEWVGQTKFGPGGQGTPDKVLMTLIGSKIGVELTDWVGPEPSSAAQEIEIPKWKGKETPASELEAAVAATANIEPSVTEAEVSVPEAIEVTSPTSKPKPARTRTRKTTSAKEPAKTGSKKAGGVGAPRKAAARAKKVLRPAKRKT
jgi:hypothetical protein